METSEPITCHLTAVGFTMQPYWMQEIYFDEHDPLGSAEALSIWRRCYLINSAATGFAFNESAMLHAYPIET